jgi:signal transduction histidine kinase
MPGGGPLKVQVARQREGNPPVDGVVVRVVDRGEGMTPEQRARIFELFFTTKTHGTGLGLPLSQQIIAAHGGQLRCQSAVGEGTTFELWFPAAVA